MQEKMKNNKFVQKKIEEERNNKYSKGITLIVLVITIIVLIILAGISINLVLGDNGLFNKAKQATEEYKQAAINEQAMLNSVDEEIANAIEENTTKDSLKKVEEAKTEGKYFDNQTELQDSDGNKVIVPKGFKIAQDSGNNVTEGIVIEDEDIQEDGNGEQRGNQYVWIPVSNTDGSNSNPIKKSDNTDVVITLGRYEFADGTSTYQDNNGSSLGVLEKGREILRQKAENYTEETAIMLYYKELKEYHAGVEKEDITGENRTAKDLGKFIESVRQNGGYYIARYEASYGADNKPNSKISTNPNDTDNEPTAEGYLWNSIKQIKAAQKCENMYETIKSDLVNSYAWDTAIVYIQRFSGDTAYSRQLSKNTTLANTGKNNDEVCKINDMASNCYEWTTEYSTYTDSSKAYPCVLRGGNWTCDYTSIRYSNVEIYSCRGYAFRTTLYLNSPES